MPRPRKEIIRDGEIAVYHTWSRCVYRAFLCGDDPFTQINFDYRRAWIGSLLNYLADVFAVDVGNYRLFSNHQHLIVRTRPDISAQWSDEEVAWRWKLAYPSWQDGQWDRTPSDQEIEELLADPQKIPRLRQKLASLSSLMARWKEPIARMANAELEVQGHFYEQRFGYRRIVDEENNLSCNMDADLDRIVARIPNLLECSQFFTLLDRLKAWRLEQAIQSVKAFRASGAKRFALDVSDVEQLLAGCFLTPIDYQRPLIQQPPQPPPCCWIAK
jgi:hypothetical protein